jgi:nicotinamidase-related amidase
MAQIDARKRQAGRNRSAFHARPGDALLIIDVINDLEFLGGEKVLPWAILLASKLVALRSKAHHAQMPVIYVNDNFGHWRNNFQEVYAHCTRKSARGREVSRRLKPNSLDYFILKPRHSGFFSTSLIPLLEDLKIERLILSGMATNLCVLFTAHDAHMHQYPIVVLSDCCAAESDFDHNIALAQLERFCGAKVCRSTEFSFPPRPLRDN